jgi:hypothetical protein
MAALLGVLASGPGYSAEPAALAFIDLRYTDNGIEVLGKALAIADIQVKGEMTISRKGAAGSVSTRQGSDLSMTKGQSAEIARVNVSYQAGDQIEVKVVLSQNGNILAQSSLKTGGL